MSDEPSARAIWNTKTFVGLLLLTVYIGLLLYGVSKNEITYKDAFALLGNASMGGGFVAWLYK